MLQPNSKSCNLLCPSFLTIFVWFRLISLSLSLLPATSIYIYTRHNQWDYSESKLCHPLMTTGWPHGQQAPSCSPEGPISHQVLTGSHVTDLKSEWGHEQKGLFSDHAALLQMRKSWMSLNRFLKRVTLPDFLNNSSYVESKSFNTKRKILSKTFSIFFVFTTPQKCQTTLQFIKFDNTNAFITFNLQNVWYTHSILIDMCWHTNPHF